jgi:uncharacterized Zn finger protein (UPF0148 family)
VGAFFEIAKPTVVHYDEIPEKKCVRVKVALSKRFMGTEEVDLSEPLAEGLTLCPSCEPELTAEIEELEDQAAEAEGAEEAEEAENDGLTDEERAARQAAAEKAEKDRQAAAKKRDTAMAKLRKKYGVPNLDAAQEAWLTILEKQEEGSPAFLFWNDKVDTITLDLLELEEEAA